ncbi:MAG: ROK family protein [Acidimicrobiia bacterium]
MTVTIGLDIGGTNLRGAVVDPHGVVVRDARTPSPNSWDEMAQGILDMIEKLRADVPDVAAVGVGAAGLVGLDGTIEYSPNVPAFRNATVGATLSERCPLPVVVDNDANVAAYAETLHGAAQGYREVLMVTLGTGIGGGIVTGGQVLRGAHGYAGEIGHFTIERNGPKCACGHRGHWEAIASGNALGRLARQAAASGGAPALLQLAGGDPENVTGFTVAQGAHAGEPDALAILDEYADNVGVGLGALANIVDPAIIVIGGGVVEMGDILLDRVRAAYARNVEAGASRAIQPVVPAALGDTAGVVGAAALARALV